jgi:threonine dehydrogenase-like Zn-dependent dehydrogenase
VHQVGDGADQVRGDDGRRLDLLDAGDRRRDQQGHGTGGVRRAHVGTDVAHDGHPARRHAQLGCRGWTDGRGADVVVEAAGVKAAFGEGTDLLADHGAYLVLGLYAGTGTVPLDPYRLTNRCLRVVGSLGATDPSAHRTTIRLARRLGERLRFAD